MFVKLQGIIEHEFCYHEVIIELMFDYTKFLGEQMFGSPSGGYTPQKRSVIFS